MTSKRILIADDEECFREWTEHLLGAAGYETITAIDGSDAFAKFGEARNASRPFNLLVADLSMPGMSGAELIAKIVAMEPFLPVIVISGKQDVESVRETLYAGSWELLPKPFKKEDLLESVGRAFEKSEILQAEAHKQSVINSLIRVERQRSAGRDAPAETK